MISLTTITPEEDNHVVVVFPNASKGWVAKLNGEEQPCEIVGFVTDESGARVADSS